MFKKIDQIFEQTCNHTFLSFLSEETAERFERAAAIAVFQGDIGRAIGSLKDGALTATRHGDMLQGV